MSSDMDPHILNFHEDLDLPLSAVPGIIRDALTGRLDDPHEKLDGQNFTFTVISTIIGPEVRFMGKGCSRWIREMGGLDRDALIKHYVDKPAVQTTFLGAYDSLQHAMLSIDRDLIDRVFLSGKAVVRTEVTSPSNPNIIKYRGNAIHLIGSQLLGSSSDAVHAVEETDALGHALAALGPIEGWSIGSMPVARPKHNHDASHVIKQLTSEWIDDLGSLTTATLHRRACVTMGDFIVERMKGRMRAFSLGGFAPTFLHDAARRIVFDDPSILPVRKMPTGMWQLLKPLDDERAMHVGEAIIDVERFFSRLGNAAIDAYDLNTSNIDDTEHIRAVHDRVIDTKHALVEGRITAAPNVLTRMQSAANRCDESLFSRNAEGIVFRRAGKLRKLVGGFTPVNRLLGYTSFGNQARVVE